jgi:hypothetical protein
MFGSFMSIEWQTNFTQWLKNLTAYLKSRGIDYAGFAIYPYDETLGDDFLKAAKLIKSIDPQVRIYANNHGISIAELNSFKSVIDIWCPAEIKCNELPAHLSQIKGFGKTTWTYESYGSEKSASPSGYYRKLPWLAFKRNLTGAGFWVYSDQGVINPWDDFAKPRSYYGVIYSSAGSPVSTNGENIIPSRRWEAWREGVEDYQYLYELQQKINSIKTSDSPKAAVLQKTLDDIVNKVVISGDSEVFYEARVAITNLLK